MQNPWKVAALGLVALAAIVGTSTLTTAFLLRPPVSQPAETSSAPDPAAEPRAAVVRVAPVAKPKPVAHVTASTSPVARPTATMPASELAPAPLSSAVITPTAESSAPASRPGAVAAAPSAATAGDCDTPGDRAARIARPGALGALLGAGLGAAGGAIAKGGKAAGQGALIGGLAGAAVGAGYGAYKAKTECGTVFGEGSSTTGEATAPLPAVAPRVERIQVYESR